MHTCDLANVGHEAIGDCVEGIHGNGHGTILGGCQRQQTTERELKCQSGNESGNTHLGNDQALYCADQHAKDQNDGNNQPQIDSSSHPLIL